MKLQVLVIPTLQFNGHNLVWVKDHKSSGVYLSDDMTDDSDIMQQMKAFYAKKGGSIFCPCIINFTLIFVVHILRASILPKVYLSKVL